MSSLWIPSRLPGLNELLAESRKSPHAYNRLKKKWTMTIGVLAGAQGFQVVGPHWSYLFIEPLDHLQRTRDVLNVVGGGVKLIEDALIDCNLVPNDNRAYVKRINPHVVYMEHTPLGVLVVAAGSDRCPTDLWHLMEANEAWKRQRKDQVNSREEARSPSRSSTSSFGSSKDYQRAKRVKRLSTSPEATSVSSRRDQYLARLEAASKNQSTKDNRSSRA